jgi:broad specificity phosphatase PhoE
MSQIFLVRHGEVEGNYGPKRTFAGWGDKPLTEKGTCQAQAVAERLAKEQLAAVYSSDLMRAFHTAEAIAARHGLIAQANPALREVNYGQWEGLGDAELLRNWADLWQRHRDQSVAIVGHNGSLRILLCHLLGAPLGNARHIRLMNTSISCVEFEDSAMEAGAARFVISSINDTCHLAGI